MTPTIDLRLTPQTTIRRRFDLLDRVEIETPDARIVIHVDPSSAVVAAEAGASLLASARRQSTDELHSETSPRQSGGFPMSTKSLAVLAVFGLAASASAQAPFPGGVQVGGAGWPCDHPIAIAAGFSCGAAPNPAPAPPAGADPCVPRPDPYTSAGAVQMQRCIASRGDNLPPLQPTVFRVGGRYYQPYPLYNMVVVSVALGIDGREIVTAQWLKTGDAHVAGEPFIVFDEDRDKWLPVTEAPMQMTARDRD